MQVEKEEAKATVRRGPMSARGGPETISASMRPNTVGSSGLMF